MKEIVIENMINWALNHLDHEEYELYCLSFIEDALEISNQIEIFGGDSAKESATLYQEALKLGEPERGAFVFYDCLCLDHGNLINYGHCGISLGKGKVIHAWDKIRVDDYLGIERLIANSNEHPKYLGYVPIDFIIQYKIEDD